MNDEYVDAAPDPLNPDREYGSKVVTKYDRRTGSVAEVGPFVGRAAFAPGGDAAPLVADVRRQVRTQPLVFSMADKKSLFYGTNVLWKTMDGGITWTRISQDLTRKHHDVPQSVGKYLPTAQTQADNNGARVIYTIGPSYKDVNRIWIGTDDGVIATTADGGLNWKDVTPAQIRSYWKVFMIDPGRFDPLTAYAAVNTLRIDDQNPHLFRTHDAGKTWTEIDNGIPGGAAVNAIREDGKKPGLLFAGSETQVYVSFDDGDHWESLRLNMAASSVRDLQVKDDDLIAGTHGRGIWILDDITPLREIGKTEEGKTEDGSTVVLFKPETALRVRWNTNTDTPLPPDEVRAPNPPEGAIIDYYLASDAQGPVVLDMADATGKPVRHYSSADLPEHPLPDPATDAPLPLYWYRSRNRSRRPACIASYGTCTTSPSRAAAEGGVVADSAVPSNTVPAPTTPWVAPGTYTVKLTVNGKTYSQPVVVKPDPRVKTPALAMQQVYTLSREMYYETRAAAAAADAARKAGHEDEARALADAVNRVAGVLNILQAADVQPTAVQLKAIAEARRAVSAALAESKPPQKK
jgi:photosystem II stability/assembly factor-like uncharacterized protein